MEIEKEENIRRWGAETTPTCCYEYTLYYPGGDIDFIFVGVFGEYRKVVINVNGEYTTRIPELANRGFLPVFGITNLMSVERKNAKVVIFQRESSVLSFNDYFRESKSEYVGICFLPESKRLPDVGLFKDRKVILWPDKDDVGDVWASRISGMLSRSADSVLVANMIPHGPGASFDSLLASSPLDVMIALEEAGDLVMDRPKIVLQDGFSHLEGFIPPKFIDAMKVLYGDDDGRIENEYVTLMKLCDEDPAFHDFVRFDRATGQMAFHPKYHANYDEADNALLNRLVQYGIKRIGKDVRFDIIKTLSLREHAVFNSVLDFFRGLSMKYRNPRDRLVEIFQKVTFQEEEGEARKAYLELFETFFKRAAAHTFRAFGSKPIPNDLVPVLVGDQGVGKSRFVRFLAMQDRLFVDLGDKGVTLGSADCIRHIGGKLIVELSEMSVYSKTEIGVAKAFISQDHDEFRQLYERSMTIVPRSANLWGTTNEVKFLRDMTGNRRFFPVRVKEIDHAYLYEHKEIIEETWAYYWDLAQKNPEAWYELSDESRKFFGEENERAMDLGFASEMVDIAIKTVEKNIFTKRSMERKLSKNMHIPNFAVGAEIQRIGGGIPYDLNKRVRYALLKLGYRDSSYYEEGKTRSGMVISMTDPELLKRVTTKEPEF